MRIFSFILLVMMLAGCIGETPYRQRGAYIFYKASNQQGYEAIAGKRDQIKSDLQKSGLLIDIIDMRPPGSNNQMMEGCVWILLGVKGGLFEGMGVVLMSYSPNHTFISIDCKYRDLSSEKVRKLKSMVSAAIGKEGMRHVKVSVQGEDMWNFRPGA